MATTKTTTLSIVAEVSTLISGTSASGFNTLQGYTITPEYTHYAVMLDTDLGDGKDVNNSHIIKGTGQNTVSSVSSSGIKPLMHANDCAYYNNKLFVATGGGTNNSKIIKAYNSSFTKVGDYTYDGKRESIGCISHLKDNNFILGSKNGLSICTINESTKKFNMIADFTFSATLDLLGRPSTKTGVWKRNVLSQGIYCTPSRLYRVYSIEDILDDQTTSQIKWNTIAEFSYVGTYPNYTGLKVENLFVCDKGSYDKFEMESISSPDNGTTFYIAGNVEINGVQQDRIYKVTLNS